MFIALAAERAVGSSGIRCCAAQVFRFGVGEGIHAPTPGRTLNRYAVVRCAISGAAWATPRAYVICHC